MAAVPFTGGYEVIYPDHTDLDTGRTLTAVPGRSYSTAAASGRAAGLPDSPGDGRWGEPPGDPPELPRSRTAIAAAPPAPVPEPPATAQDSKE